jgi:hypothetical protein
MNIDSSLTLVYELTLSSSLQLNTRPEAIAGAPSLHPMDVDSFQRTRFLSAIVDKKPSHLSHIG